MRDRSEPGERAERTPGSGVLSFQSLLDRYGPDVHRFLVAAVGAVDAADAFQETLLSALRAYPKLKDHENVRGWLFTIAHRKSIDLHRTRQRQPVPVERLPDRAAHPAPDPPDRDLWAAVRSLPPKQRHALLHRFVADLSYADIGGVVGCSEEAARQNVKQALKSLRKERDARVGA